jgi:hypothetical protein
MENLPACTCCRTIPIYIAEHLEPSRTIHVHDDPQKIYIQIQELLGNAIQLAYESERWVANDDDPVRPLSEYLAMSDMITVDVVKDYLSHVWTYADHLGTVGRPIICVACQSPCAIRIVQCPCCYPHAVKF